MLFNNNNLLFKTPTLKYNDYIDSLIRCDDDVFNIEPKKASKTRTKHNIDIIFEIIITNINTKNFNMYFLSVGII